MQRLFLQYNDKFQSGVFVHAALTINGKAEHAEAEQHHGARFGDGSGLPDKVVISAFHGVVENSTTRSTAESDRAEMGNQDHPSGPRARARRLEEEEVAQAFPTCASGRNHG